MIAIVEGLRVQRIDRVERDKVDSGCFQSLEEIRLRAVGPEAVIDDIDRNALLPLGEEKIAATFATVLDVLENVIFEIDVILRVLDRAEHGGEPVLPPGGDPPFG